MEDWRWADFASHGASDGAFPALLRFPRPFWLFSERLEAPPRTPNLSPRPLPKRAACRFNVHVSSCLSATLRRSLLAARDRPGPADRRRDRTRGGGTAVLRFGGDAQSADVGRHVGVQCPRPSLPSASSARSSRASQQKRCARCSLQSDLSARPAPARLGRVGATGLEPATSGVTGRFGYRDTP
jgi:hypothetical protein